MKSLTLSKRHKNITLAAVFTTAGVLYCLISLVNHYLFKTYALDLGLYTHAMYDYAHFRIDDCSMFLPQPQSICLRQMPGSRKPACAGHETFARFFDYPRPSRSGTVL